ncbi:MAG: polyprenol monophosphomannose synthase [Deltaproteobacteria bacterium]|nr:polyprenol monophosphomannose synthase [Deltaproteobacteria bacterium]MBI3294625.1 polyprenol monophosphomannose synthase [Deltaproteobacteria bacterium]
MKTNLIIIPTYNEKENIEAIVRATMKAVPDSDFLIVDDNSPDGTAEIVRQKLVPHGRVNMLNRARKGGLAGAYIAGFDWAGQKGYQQVVQMDADFSHAPADVAKVVAALTGHDLVIGCRYMDGGGTSGWSFLRTGISRGGNFYARSMLKLPFTDLTGGFTAWKLSALQKIHYSTILSRGYAFQVELKYRSFKNGLNVVEVPIHFENRKLGKSKMSSQIVVEAAFRVARLRFGHHG